MKRPLILIILLILIVLGLFLIFQKEHAQDSHELVLYGNVDVRQVDLGFRVTGRVEKMFYEEGDLVEPGVLMGTLEKQPYIDQVKEAEANVESQGLTLRNSETLLQRRQELVGNGGVSKEDLETAQSNKNVLASQLKQVEASLGVAWKNLKDTDVYAPTKGVILTRIREPGTVVLPGDPIYTLSISDPVWVRAYVSEPYLGKIFPGMNAEIYTDTPGGKIYHGKIGFISPLAEFTPKTVETQQLRTDLVYRLRIYVDNPDLGLRQGMPVTVKLPMTQRR